MGKSKSAVKTPLDIYLAALCDHLAIETKAMETTLSELPRCKQYLPLCRQMETDLQMSRAHAREITTLLARHGHPAPVPHETVSSILSTVSDLLHHGEEDDVLKNISASAGYGAHQIRSLRILSVMAQRLGLKSDAEALDMLLKEECEAFRAVDTLLPEVVSQYLGAP